MPLAPFEIFHPWWGGGFYGGFRNGLYGNHTTIVNNINVANVYRNARVAGGVTGVNAGEFGRSARFTSLNQNQIQQAGLVHGVLPVSPDRSSLRMSDRSVSGSFPQTRAQGFASRMQAPRVDHVSFEQQQRGMQQISRSNFNEGSRAGAGNFGGAGEAGISAAMGRPVGSAPIARVRVAEFPVAQLPVAQLPVAMVGPALASRFMVPTLAGRRHRQHLDLLRDRSSGSRTLGRKARRRDRTMRLVRILETAAASRSGSVHPSCSSARRVMKRRAITKRPGAPVAVVERAAHRVADPAGAVEAVTRAADTEVTAKFESFLPSARSRPSRRIRAFFLLGIAVPMLKLEFERDPEW